MVSLLVAGLTEGLQYYMGRGFNIDIVVFNVLGGEKSSVSTQRPNRGQSNLFGLPR